ncbi:MAG: hypothetical protein WDW38_008178 [Sanguina aurantia]
MHLLGCRAAGQQSSSLLLEHPDMSQLIEVVMDLGRPPLARFPSGETQLSEVLVTSEDLAQAVAQVGTFDTDNRAGIDATLHRISCMRNRGGRVVGLTCRVGRAIQGSASLVEDLVRAGKSVLLLGRPGVGKTTAIREICRVLAGSCQKRVVIVDTSNEIAGDGDVPHPGIGEARRMQVPQPHLQHRLMIEAVENHMPECIVIDEIGTAAECLAARTIAQRGVQLVATAHGNELENVIKNPLLSDLVGGIATVTLGDEAARKRGIQKTILERASPPTFDVAVELMERNRWRVHLDVAAAVDAILQGGEAVGQIRERSPDDGEVTTFDFVGIVRRIDPEDGRLRRLEAWRDGSGNEVLRPIAISEQNAAPAVSYTSAPYPRPAAQPATASARRGSVDGGGVEGGSSGGWEGGGAPQERDGRVRLTGPAEWPTEGPSQPTAPPPPPASLTPPPPSALSTLSSLRKVTSSAPQRTASPTSDASTSDASQSGSDAAWDEPATQSSSGSSNGASTDTSSAPASSPATGGGSSAGNSSSSGRTKTRGATSSISISSSSSSKAKPESTPTDNIRPPPSIFDRPSAGLHASQLPELLSEPSGPEQNPGSTSSGLPRPAQPPQASSSGTASMRVFLAMDSPSAARAFAMIGTLDAARTVRVVGVEENADVIVATRSHLRKNPKIKSTARRLGVPLYAVRASTPALLARDLCPLLGLQPSQGAGQARGQKTSGPGDNFSYGRRYSPASLSGDDEHDDSTESVSDEDGVLDESEEAGVTTRSLATLTWALAHTKHRKKFVQEQAAELQTLAQGCQDRLTGFAPADLLRLATGFAGLRFYPGSRWLAALVSSCEGLQEEGGGLGGQDPEKLRQALSSLHELASEGIQ